MGTFSAYSQSSSVANLFINRDLSTQIDASLHRLDANFHTSVKPYRLDEIPSELKFTLFDSTNQLNRQKGFIKRKLLYEHLVTLKGDDYRILINPLFDFQLGRATDGGNNPWQNTRGAMVQGDLGNKFSFVSVFLENQGVFVSHIDSFITQYRVAPGQAAVKNFKTDGFDYGFAFGYLSFSPTKHINLQLGQDKLFIGDGYRSLILSDNASPAPYFRFTMDLKPVKYLFQVNQYIDRRPLRNPSIYGYPRKWSFSHYADVNIGKRVSLGIFESVIYAAEDSGVFRGFDAQYLNPFIFFRPVEFAIGSPDNVIIGTNIKVKLSNTVSIYNQMVLDEFKLDEIRAQNGWWANKYGFQTGIKAYNIAKVQNLNAQAEYNFVRPFTYTHFKVDQAWANNNQPLAHPLGANFKEFMGIVNYRYKRYFTELRIQSARFGTDSLGTNFGQDIFLDYRSRTLDYGNEIGQGKDNKLTNIDFRVAYLLNPNTNMRVELSVNNRKLNIDGVESSNNTWIMFSFKTALFNTYTDF